MKKILLSSMILFAGFAVRAHAGFPPVQDRGAVSTGTIFNVMVTTTPRLLISTGANVMYEQDPANFFIPQTTATLPVNGQYMRDRMFLEIKNDSPDDIFIGYENTVSTLTGNARRGRKVEASGGVWSHDCSIEHHWIVSGTVGSTVTVTQEK